MTVPGSDRAKSQVDPGVPVVVEETVLSLASFLMSLTARINRGNDANIQPVSIRAIPIKPPSNRKSYNGILYCGLQDPNGRDHRRLDRRKADRIGSLGSRVHHRRSG